jgi:hypothetical protein
VLPGADLVDSFSADDCLARQLLTAKLNVASNTDPCVLPLVAQADLFLSGGAINGVEGPQYLGPGVVIPLRDAQRQIALVLKSRLETYNVLGNCSSL